MDNQQPRNTNRQSDEDKTVRLKYIDGTKDCFVTESGEIYIRVHQSNTNGYSRARIPIYDEDGKIHKKEMKVHRLVAKAYLENPENKPDVNHIDGDKRNNSVDNLEWATRMENMRHAHSTGLFKWKFSEKSNAYTESQVRHVFSLLEMGVALRTISEETGVKYQQVIQLRNGKRHTDIASEYRLPVVPKRGISKEQAKEICEMLESGKSRKEILKYYNNEISDGVVRLIQRGKTFKEISKNYNFINNKK